MKPSGRFEFFVRHGGLAVAEFSFKEFESLPHGFSRFVQGCSAHNFREGFTRRTLCLLQDFIVCFLGQLIYPLPSRVETPPPHSGLAGSTASEPPRRVSISVNTATSVTRSGFRNLRWAVNKDGPSAANFLAPSAVS